MRINTVARSGSSSRLCVIKFSAWEFRMKNLSGFCGGALLCCSAVGFWKLSQEWPDGLFSLGLMWSALCHIATGVMQIESHTRSEGRSPAKLASSVGLAMLWCCIQVGIAIAFAEFIPQISRAAALLELATGCIGLTLILGLALHDARTRGAISTG